MHYASDGVPITLTEEDIKQRYPWRYNDLIEKCKSRYSDFKKNNLFNHYMREVKSDSKLCHVRSLDPDNPKSLKQQFYSTNVWKVLDKYYQKR